MSDEISLFALMDSHLSKTRLNETSIENHGSNPCGSASDVLLPSSSGPRLVIPNFFPGKTPMKDFLAEQISNALKAKEKRKQEEQKRIEDKMQCLKIKEELVNIESLAKMNLEDEQEYLIDLTPAIIQQTKPNQNNIPNIVVKETLLEGQSSNAGQDRPKFSERASKWDKESCQYKKWNPDLPCTTDMSYFLKRKTRRGKCSRFGKIFCSRVRPVRPINIPYEKRIESNVVSFDFGTKSPGDIYKESIQWKPKMSTRWTADITDYI